MYELLYIIGGIALFVLGTDIVVHLVFADLKGLIETKYKYYRIMALVLCAVIVVFVLMNLIDKVIFST